MGPLRKRVVLMTPDRPPRIVGVFDESVHTIRDTLEITDPTGRVIQTKLAKVTPRTIIYREQAGLVKRLIDKLTP
jgi:hypothetical protein